MAERPDAVEAKVEEMRAKLSEHTARVRALEQSERERDLASSQGTRRRYGVTFGVLFGLYNVVLGVLDQLEMLTVDHLTYTVGSGVLAVLVGTPALRRHRQLQCRRKS